MCKLIFCLKVENVSAFLMYDCKSNVSYFYWWKYFNTKMTNSQKYIDYWLFLVYYAVWKRKWLTVINEREKELWLTLERKWWNTEYWYWYLACCCWFRQSSVIWIPGSIMMCWLIFQTISRRWKDRIFWWMILEPEHFLCSLLMVWKRKM